MGARVDVRQHGGVNLLEAVDYHELLQPMFIVRYLLLLFL